MYTMEGREVLTEAKLSHLRGYRGSVPVCIGNAATQQLQLDMYGALMDALYLSEKYGEQACWQTWQRITHSMNWLAHNWQRPDEGIWEVRGARREFLYSRLRARP
jgi:GH15 family glucan-1,4-alpha-glucosidase